MLFRLLLITTIGPFAALTFTGCARDAEVKKTALTADSSPSRPTPPAPTKHPAACDAPNLPQRGLRVGTVSIKSESGPISFAVTLAETAIQRQRGLMCRTFLGPNEGMFFAFPRMQRLGFWMKNTLIPLDMIFIDDGGRVVGIVENAPPLTLKSRRVEGLSRYVLELNGGTAARMGIRTGQFVFLPAKITAQNSAQPQAEKP